ncbi:UNVERIFIED_CONTAM: hypothetical protein Sindi_2916900 [Sesamum indicum]
MVLTTFGIPEDPSAFVHLMARNPWQTTYHGQIMDFSPGSVRTRFHWPNRDWTTDIEWAMRKWRGKHIINSAYRTLLGSCRTPATLSILIVDDVRQRILKVDLASSVSTRALYRLWHVEYEWLPPKCTECMTLGHSAKECTLTKPQKQEKPPVKVYVPKVHIPTPTDPEESQLNHETVVEVEEVTRREEGADQTEHEVSSHNERETRVRINSVVHIQSFLLPHWKWFVDYASVGNRIWIAWDENEVDVQILEMGNQFIHCRVTNRADSEPLIITVIYGASELADRRSLWNTLDLLARQCTNDPWLVGGDFNAVRDMNEVCGASGDIRIAIEEFNASIQVAGLLPLPMQGEWYTWHNCSTSPRSLWKRLDRMLINDRWLARFPSSYYHSLMPRTSDHSPLVIHGDRQNQTRGMFRFDNYLTLSPEFIPSVQNIWNQTVIGVPMFAITRKLKALKPVFRQQRRKKGDLTLNVHLAKGFLDEAQHLVSLDRQNEAFLQLEHCCRLVYAKAVKLEQIMLQQRAKMQWMKGGDQCSRIFFRKIAQRRVARRIMQINDDNGTTHTESGEITNEFVRYYQNLLGGNRRQLPLDIRFLRPWARHVLTTEEAGQLILAFSPEDVKQAVFDIAEDKAPGPDGFSSGFFKAAWSVVGHEITTAVLDFFSTGKTA